MRRVKSRARGLYRHTSDKTKKINIAPIIMRGGFRL